MRAIIVLLAAAALGATPAAAAPPVSVPVPSLPDALAYAPGHVLWATHTPHGPVVVHEEPAGGGPERVLATVARVHPSSDDVFVTLAANASGYAVGVGHGRAPVRHRDGHAARSARRAGLARRPQPGPG